MNPGNGLAERREYSRRDVLALAEVILSEQMETFPGNVFNISPKGLYLETDARLHAGDQFQLRIVRSQNLLESHIYPCSVIWHHTVNDPDTGLYGYGAQFVYSAGPPPSS